jgi:hypothetical protein
MDTGSSSSDVAEIPCMDPGSSSPNVAEIPGMDFGSSSSDVVAIPGMDPGSSSSDASSFYFVRAIYIEPVSNADDACSLCILLRLNTFKTMLRYFLCFFLMSGDAPLQMVILNYSVYKQDFF